MTYRGDSVGKKIARYFFWQNLSRTMSSDISKFNELSFLYLASHEGGDASVLRGLGVPAHRQLAVDRDPEALAAFHARWPDVPVEQGDVADVVERLKKRFDVVFLDFCAHLSDEILRTVVRTVAVAGKSLGCLALAYMRGREKGPFYEDIEFKRGRTTVSGTVLIDETTDKSLDGRHDLLTARLESRLLPHRIDLATRGVYTYQSRTDASPGSPMAISEYLLMRLDRNMPLRAYMRYKRDRSEVALKEAIKTETGKKAALAVDYDFWNEEHLRTTVLVVMDKHQLTSTQAALAFNIDPKTVAAWKAHNTRGTYGIE